MAKARTVRTSCALANGNSSVRFAHSVVTVAGAIYRFGDFCLCGFIVSLFGYI